MLNKNRVNSFLIISGLTIFLSISACHKKSDPAPVSDGKLFPKVRNIIQVNCTSSCHAPSKGLPDGLPVVLETDSDLVNHAQAIKSAVADPVTLTNKRMPSGGQLNQADVDIIVSWFTNGGSMSN